MSLCLRPNIWVILTLLLPILNMKNEPIHIVLRDARYDTSMRLTLFLENSITQSGCRPGADREFTNVIRKSDEKSIMVGRLRNRAKWVQFI